MIAKRRLFGGKCIASWMLAGLATPRLIGLRPHVIPALGKKMKLSFNLEDASQVAIGAFALAVPISFSEEAWKLGETLPLTNLLMVFVLSVSFLGFFAYESVFQGNIKYRIPVFLWRIAIAYAITAIVVALVLFSLNKFPLFTDTLVAFQRLIIIAMPASMGAIIVDSFDKE